jgi:mRNA-degrading endonuclease toxin of MazEF toxin-antitoxin module
MIQAQHLYWVNFNPTRAGEFPDTHLAIVLELNADKRTCRILPLTRSSRGLGTNKISLGTLHNFSDISYAVLDQVRTISISRMAQHINSAGVPTV